MDLYRSHRWPLDFTWSDMAYPLLIGFLLLALYVSTAFTQARSKQKLLTWNTVDALISFAWFAAFGILVDAIHNLPCGSIWTWYFSGDSVCARWKAAEAFSFLSAIVWLVSALVVCIRAVPLNHGLALTELVRGFGLPSALVETTSMERESSLLLYAKCLSFVVSEWQC